MATSKPIILFDGVCNLCNRSVQFIIKRDKEKKFMFASFQSHFGQQLIKRLNLPLEELNSFLLFSDETLFSKSTGALKVISQLDGMHWTKRLFFIPKILRDTVYTIFAKNRYRWFGKKEECILPTIELRERFLE